ncbi:MAG: hypothetical protein AAGJ81_10130 [Verrucomicrobiota bacterium]
MKFLLLPFCLVLCGCSATIGILTEEQIDRDYAGTIVFGQPRNTGKGITIPLRFSGGGWSRNSGICFKRSETEIDDGIITLRVFTSACTGNNVKPMMFLDQPDEGNYRIEFEDPDGKTHSLTEIVIP